EMRDLAIKTAGQASIPDRLVHAGVAPPDLDLALELDELIVTAPRMNLAGARFHGGVDQRREFRHGEDEKATHATASSCEACTNLTLWRQSCSIVDQRPLSSSSMAAAIVAAASTASGSSRSRRLRVISSGYQLGSRK